MKENAQLDATTNDLTPRQEAALERLLAGERPTDVARALEIDRVTLWRWRRVPTFRGRLDMAEQEALAAARQRLVRAAEQAADVVVNAVEQGDVRAALALLKGLRLLGHDSREMESQRLMTQWGPVLRELRSGP